MNLKQAGRQEKNILRRLSHVLMSTGFFHIFGSSAINQFVRIVYVIIIPQIVTKPEFGVFTSANNIYLSVMLLSGFGMAAATLQLSSEHAGGQVRSKWEWRWPISLLGKISKTPGITSSVVFKTT